MSTEDLEERINKALINTGIKSEYVPEEILTSFKEQLRNLWLESIEVARYNSLFDTEDFSGETGLAENSQIEGPDNQEIEKSNNAPPALASNLMSPALITEPVNQPPSPFISSIIVTADNATRNNLSHNTGKVFGHWERVNGLCE